MKSMKIRGCGLGYLVYGGRKAVGKEVIYSNPLSMDSLRLAIPRNEYSDKELISYLSVIGEVYSRGDFKKLKNGDIPLNYVDNGFYHFGGQYHFVDE
jgi:hypothetical protein